MSDNPQKASSSPPAAFDLSKLRDELECCICLNLFKEPKYLPCGHNCCAACVQGLIDAANQPIQFITCPECREEVPVPADGQFPTAFVVKKLVSHFKHTEHPNEVKMEILGLCSACHKFGPCHQSLFCIGCHDSATRKEQNPDPDKMAKAEGLRLQGVQAYERNALVEAIQLYTQSIRECPRPICLINRAEVAERTFRHIKLGRFSLAYVDANEALMLDPRNEKAKMLRVEALEGMGIGQKDQEKKMVVCANTEAEASMASWPKNLRIDAVCLTNRGYVEENLVGLVQEKVVCMGDRGESMQIPLDQLDKFLNEHVEGAVHRVQFEFVKFDEQMVQMLRLIKRERFEHVDRRGEKDLVIYWFNCDFSRISEASFRFLLDELICPARIYIADWIGMPAGQNYNTLFKMKAFRDAWSIDYNFDRKIAPNSPNFNLHLDSNMLIDFLHSPGYRKLNLVDGQLQDGFDSFLDRLIQRFNQDTERRCYVLVILVLNATKETKERLKLGTALILEHPKGNGKLKCTLTKATGVLVSNYGSYNIDDIFQFNADRSSY